MHYNGTNKVQDLIVRLEDDLLKKWVCGFAVIVSIGCFLPWVTISTILFSVTESGMAGDGKLIVGAMVIVIAVTGLAFPVRLLNGAIAALVLGDLLRIIVRVLTTDSPDDVVVGLGYGIIICALGAGAILALSLFPQIVSGAAGPQDVAVSQASPQRQAGQSQVGSSQIGLQPVKQPQLPPTPAPSGWYPSVSVPNQQQWWDGQNWTPNTRPQELSVEKTNVQLNACQRAEAWLGFTAFSKPGLVKRLVDEGFTQLEAQYATDSAIVDWDEQPTKKAAECLRVRPLSRTDLIKQLVAEGFTQAEAQQGADASGL